MVTDVVMIEMNARLQRRRLRLMREGFGEVVVLYMLQWLKAQKADPSIPFVFSFQTLCQNSTLNSQGNNLKEAESY